MHLRVAPPDPAGLASAVALFAGLGLVAWAGFVHLSVAFAARCDGCAPWHPLFVLGPLAAGAGLLALGAFIRTR